jgi:hypothetical protein
MDGALMWCKYGVHDQVFEFQLTGSNSRFLAISRVSTSYQPSLFGSLPVDEGHMIPVGPEIAGNGDGMLHMCHSLRWFYKYPNNPATS